MNSPDHRAIEQLFERFVGAFNEENLEVLRSCYTNDALVIPPSQPTVRGVDAIIDQLWGPTFVAFEVEAALPIDEIQLDGEWGFIRGTYQLRMNPSGGGDLLSEDGRYIDVVRKTEEGAWKIARAIWNRAEA